MNENKEMIHFNLDLSPELNDTLEEIARKIASPTGVKTPVS